MAKTVSAFTVGLLFGIGLLVSGMANPAKVLAFLDVTGRWDPSLAFVLGGAVVVETVYSWPGLGRLAFEAVMSRDFSVLLGILLLSSLLVIIANMTVDLVQAWLDPRIETR